MSGSGLRFFFANRTVSRFDVVFDGARVGRDADDVFRFDNPRKTRPAKQFQQVVQLLVGVKVGLVDNQQNWFVTAGEFDQGRMLGLVQVGIGNKQHQIGPLGRVASHLSPFGSVDFVEPGRVEQHHA